MVNLPDFAYWRVGYELTDWSEATLALPGAREHPLAPAVHGGAARGACAWGTTRERSGSPGPAGRLSG